MKAVFIYTAVERTVISQPSADGLRSAATPQTSSLCRSTTQNVLNRSGRMNAVEAYCELSSPDAK